MNDPVGCYTFSWLWMLTNVGDCCRDSDKVDRISNNVGDNENKYLRVSFVSLLVVYRFQRRQQQQQQPQQQQKTKLTTIIITIITIIIIIINYLNDVYCKASI